MIIKNKTKDEIKEILEQNNIEDIQDTIERLSNLASEMGSVTGNTENHIFDIQISLTEKGNVVSRIDIL